MAYVVQACLEFALSLLLQEPGSHTQDSTFDSSDVLATAMKKDIALGCRLMVRMLPKQWPFAIWSLGRHRVRIHF